MLSDYLPWKEWVRRRLSLVSSTSPSFCYRANSLVSSFNKRKLNSLARVREIALLAQA